MNESDTNSALSSSGACNLKEPSCRVDTGYTCASKRGQQRRVAGAAADVDNPIPSRDPGALHRRHRYRIELSGCGFVVANAPIQPHRASMFRNRKPVAITS